MKTYKEFINEARQPTWRVYFKGGPNPVVVARNTAEAIKKAEKIAKKQKPNHSLERTGKGVEKLTALKEGWGAAKQKRDQEAMKKEHDKYRSKIGPHEKDEYDALIKKGYRGSAAYKKMRGLK